MNTIVFKEKHADTIPAKSIELAKQIFHYRSEIAPNFDDMEDWQINEYVEVYKSNLLKLIDNINYMIENESVFNEILCEHNLTTVIFCAKYLFPLCFYNSIENTNEETATKIEEFAKKFTGNKNERYQVGEFIEFWAGYYNDIRIRTKITGFENENIYVFWDCFWFPIQDNKKRNIVKSKI